MKYLLLLLIGFLLACEGSKKVVAVTSTITVDTLYTLRAADGTICIARASTARNIKPGDTYNCMW